MTLGDVYVRHLGSSSGAHFTRVTIGSVTLWFSYETLVGFQVSVNTIVVRENDWGAVTGKHLAKLDGGGVEAKKYRLPFDEFAREFKKQTKGVIEIS